MERTGYSVNIGTPSKDLSDSFFNDCSEITPGKPERTEVFALCATNNANEDPPRGTPNIRRTNQSSSGSDMTSASRSPSIVQAAQRRYAEALADVAEAKLHIKEGRLEIARLDLVQASTRSSSGSQDTTRSRTRILRRAPAGSPLNPRSLMG